MKMKLQRKSKIDRQIAARHAPGAPRPVDYPPLTTREQRKERRRFAGAGGYQSPSERRARRR